MRRGRRERGEEREGRRREGEGRGEEGGGELLRVFKKRVEVEVHEASEFRSDAFRFEAIAPLSLFRETTQAQKGGRESEEREEVEREREREREKRTTETDTRTPDLVNNEISWPRVCTLFCQRFDRRQSARVPLRASKSGHDLERSASGCAKEKMKKAIGRTFLGLTSPPSSLFFAAVAETTPRRRGAARRAGLDDTDGAILEGVIAAVAERCILGKRGKKKG